MSTSKLTCGYLEDYLTTDSLRSLWQSVVDGCPWATVFNEPSLIQAWFETKGKEQGAEGFVLNYESKYGLLIFPIVRYAKKGFSRFRRRLMPPGQPHFDYQEPVMLVRANCSVDWTDLWRGLLDEIAKFNLGELYMGFRLREGFEPHFSTPDLSVHSPYINLEGLRSLEDFLSQKPKRLRTDVRRQRRKLEGIGTLSLETHLFEGANRLKSYDQMLDCYARLHAAESSADLFKSSGTYLFFKRLIKDEQLSRWIHFSEMQLSQKPVSWHVGFSYRDSLHYYKPTYSPDYANLSPGKVHLALLVQEGIQLGWKTIDMGCGDEHYKKDWSDGAYLLRRIDFSTNTFRAKFLGRVLGLLKK